MHLAFLFVEVKKSNDDRWVFIIVGGVLICVVAIVVTLFVHKVCGNHQDVTSKLLCNFVIVITRLTITWKLSVKVSNTTSAVLGVIVQKNSPCV